MLLWPRDDMLSLSMEWPDCTRGWSTSRSSADDKKSATTSMKVALDPTTKTKTRFAIPCNTRIFLDVNLGQKYVEMYINPPWSTGIFTTDHKHLPPATEKTPLRLDHEVSCPHFAVIQPGMRPGAVISHLPLPAGHDKPSGPSTRLLHVRRPHHP
ncbi:hypothetical protein BDZ85DRAFT_100016 [Elsinoe ampelina]|uniref:Uncharacterized protein n=1 Tax=Elsinoe ampelina TaxID=302913 RepID=A0A6A6GEZ7_9PEZI|nr:hypothetical protein BDZ85DRAFT_100016 [Elsinoe ampelina]